MFLAIRKYPDSLLLLLLLLLSCLSQQSLFDLLFFKENKCQSTTYFSFTFCCPVPFQNLLDNYYKEHEKLLCVGTKYTELFFCIPEKVRKVCVCVFFFPPPFSAKRILVEDLSTNTIIITIENIFSLFIGHVIQLFF